MRTSRLSLCIIEGVLVHIFQTRHNEYHKSMNEMIILKEMMMKIMMMMTIMIIMMIIMIMKIK